MPDTQPNGLLALRFKEPLMAQECVLAMGRLAKNHVIEIDDIAIVRHTGGRTRIQQTRDLNTGQGASAGGWVGALVGMLGGPGGMIAGGALGAAVGGLWAKLHDVGIDDDHMKEMGNRLQSGESVVFILMKDCHVGGLAKELRRFDAEIFESTLTDTADELIRESLTVEV